MTILPYKLQSTSDLLTSRSGLLLPLALMKQLQLEGLVNQYFSTRRSNRAFAPWRYIQTFVLMHHDYLPSLEHVGQLNEDKALLSVLPFDHFPKATSLGRFLHRSGASWRDHEAIWQVNKRLVSQALGKCSQVTLDIDATQIRGNKTSAEYTYKGEKGYMPMVGHIAQSSQIVALEFRAGHVPPAKDNLAFIKQCQANLPKGVKVAQLRADGASYQSAIMDYCYEQGIDFAIRAKLHASLRAEIAQIEPSRWQVLESTPADKSQQSPEKHTLCLAHCMDKSKYGFNLIIERTTLPIETQLSLPLAIENTNLKGDEKGEESYTSGRYIYRAIATNKHTLTHRQLIDFYNQRAEDSENRLKEYKRDFCADRLPCSNFHANAFYTQLCALSYNLFALSRTWVTDMDRKRAITVRRQCYDIAAKVTKTARYIIIKLREDHRQKIQQALAQIRSIPPPIPISNA